MTGLATKSSNLFRRLALALLIGSVPAAAFGQASRVPQSAPARTTQSAPARTTQPAPAATAPAAPAAPLMTLAQIPGVTVQYYDVTGKTIKDIRASIEAQRPKDPTGVAVPSSASWSIRTNLKRATTGNQCKIVGATASFSATVVMPRLASVEGVPEPVLKQWQAYVARLEHQQAMRLRQPYDRRGEVERAVMASTCEGAQEAANRAIAAITADPAPAPTTPATPAAPPAR